MKNSLVTTASKMLAKTKFTVKKHSPEILLGVGIVSGVAATVAACKGTLEIDKVLAKHNETMDKIRSYPVDKEYTEEKKKKDTTVTYIRTAASIAKIYAPAIALGALSVTSILASYNVIHKRNVALSAAYTALDQTFKEYRQRVIDKIGAEAEEKIYYNLEDGEVEEKVTDDKGKEKTVKKKVKIAKGGGSEFSKYLTRANSNYTDSEDYLGLWLRGKQNYYNDKLEADGYLILNDIYRDMGFEDTKSGMIAGYVTSRKNPKYVEITCKPVYLPSEYDGELEKCYLIDFKDVDPDIYSQLA